MEDPGNAPMPMTRRVLLDTNVLVYAYDRSEPAKQQRAMALLASRQLRRSAALSTQVLAELFVVVTRKIADPLTQLEAQERVGYFASEYPVLPVSEGVVLQAVRGVLDHQLSYWNSQLWATASANGIAAVLSEDLTDGAVVEGVEFRNPFRPDFDHLDWTRQRRGGVV